MNIEDYDYGYEAMENFDLEEFEKGADFIIKNKITPNLDNI